MMARRARRIRLRLFLLARRSGVFCRRHFASFFARRASISACSSGEVFLPVGVSFFTLRRTLLLCPLMLSGIFHSVFILVIIRHFSDSECCAFSAKCCIITYPSILFRPSVPNRVPQGSYPTIITRPAINAIRGFRREYRGSLYNLNTARRILTGVLCLPCDNIDK